MDLVLKTACNSGVIFEENLVESWGGAADAIANNMANRDMLSVLILKPIFRDVSNLI